MHTANGVRVLSIVDIEHGTMRTLDVNGLAVDYWVAWLPGTTSELLFGSRSGIRRFASGPASSRSRPMGVA